MAIKKDYLFWHGVVSIAICVILFAMAVMYLILAFDQT